MPNFSLNPFSSPLLGLIQSITPTKKEHHKIKSSLDQVSSYVNRLDSQNTVPILSNSPLLIVGSHSRDTDILPITHVDVYLELDPKNLTMQDSGTIVQLLNNTRELSACIDQAHHLIPLKIIERLQLWFSEKFSVELSHTKQTLKIAIPHSSIEVRLTPSFEYKEALLIPQVDSQLLWLPTNPDILKNLVDHVDKKHHGMIRPAIRFMKYWNDKKNNSAFRNCHIEMIFLLIFDEIPTPTSSVSECLTIFTDRMAKYIYNCPDPTKLNGPVHSYLPDSIDQWYLFMNRIAELKSALIHGESEVVRFAKKSD